MSSERTEQPTPKRKREARRKGQIARSPEVVAWAQMLAATIVLRFSLTAGGDAFRGLFERVEQAAARPDAGVALRLLGDGAWAMGTTLVPLLAGMVVIGVAGSVAQTGFAFGAAGLKPKWERVNPVQGVKRLLSPASAWEAAKALIKVAVLTAVAWAPISGLASTLAGASRPPVGEVAAVVASSTLTLIRNTAAAGLALAGADYAYQRRRVRKAVMMTMQEVREEYRQSEGDPHLKAQIRRRQAEMSRNRMMAEVSSATVVVVNPTHVAVALRYRAGSGAPRVVAKGKGPVAARIRQEAERHQVPVVRDQPLARSLHAACRLGQEIPAELYEAVARVLAFVLSLRRRSA